MKRTLSAIALTVAGLTLTGCAAGQEVEQTTTPEATLKATQLCIINETETPLDIRWKVADLGSDGDKLGAHAITKSNSGKVCGLGSSGSLSINNDVIARAGTVTLTAVNPTIGVPQAQVIFETDDQRILCLNENYDYQLGAKADFSCNGTTLTVERQSDTDYKNFLVTFTSVGAK